LPLSRFLYVANIDAPSILNYKPFWFCPNFKWD
jgi:hypothetical protein